MRHTNQKSRTKGLSSMMFALVGIILAVLFLFLYSTGIGKQLLTGIGLLGEKVGEIEQDCDRDLITKMEGDVCPCTFGTSSLKYNGCPEDKKNAEFSKEDTITCFQYVSKNNPGTLVPECDTGDKDDCITKCEAVYKGIQIVPGEKAKESGRKGDWDLYVESLEVTNMDKFDDTKITSSSAPMAQFNINLNGKEYASLELKYKLANKGKEDFAEKIRVVVEVCPEKNEKDCQENGETEQKYSTYEIAQTSLGEVPEWQETQFIDVGINGDACDGKGEKKCYLRLVVDKNEDGSGSLAEKNETNNKAWVYLILENQKFTESDVFVKYKAVELVINDDYGDPNRESKAIYQVCKGYIGEIGDGDGFSCNSHGSPGINTCESGEFPSEKGSKFSESWPDNKGCLIVVSEEDYYDEFKYDCGFMGARDEVIIDSNTYQKIEPLKTEFTNSDGDDAYRAQDYLWKATAEGSLLCKDGWWLLCNDNVKNELVLIDNKEYQCAEGSIWKQR